MPGSKEHIPNSAENYASWLRHGTVLSSAVGPVPNSAVDPIRNSVVDKNSWLCHVATLSCAARRPPTQLQALKTPYGSATGQPLGPLLGTRNSVVGSLCSSTTDSVPSSAVGP
jgi:hypothetical protein